MTRDYTCYTSKITYKLPLEFPTTVRFCHVRVIIKPLQYTLAIICDTDPNNSVADAFSTLAPMIINEFDLNKVDLWFYQWCGKYPGEPENTDRFSLIDCEKKPSGRYLERDLHIVPKEFIERILKSPLPPFQFTTP